MEIIRTQSRSQSKEKGIVKLHELLALHAGNPILLLFAGGSNINLISSIDEYLFGAHMTIGMVDDRYSQDPHVNNFIQLMAEPGFKLATNEHNVHVISSSVLPDETHDSYGLRVDKQWKQWIEENPEGKVITILGMGADSHIAGIFPGFDMSESFVMAYSVGDAHEYADRMTATPYFLKNHVDHAICIANGEQKRAAIDSVLAEDGSETEHPARILREMSDALLITDIL